MSKEAFYFSHDYEPTGDPKLQALVGEFGAVGYGVFWRIIEMLHSNSEHRLPLKQYLYLAIAKQMLASAEQIQAIIQYCLLPCELFLSDDEYFWSNRVNNNFEKRAELSEKRAVAGRLGAIAKQNLAKPSKGKKRKEKENNIYDFDFLEPEFKDVFITWLEYKKDRRETYKNKKSIEACYDKLKKLANNNPSTAKAIVNDSMANNYAGIFALKQIPKHDFIPPVHIIRPDDR